MNEDDIDGASADIRVSQPGEQVKDPIFRITAKAPDGTGAPAVMVEFLGKHQKETHGDQPPSPEVLRAIHAAHKLIHAMEAVYERKLLNHVLGKDQERAMAEAKNQVGELSAAILAAGGGKES